MRLVALLVSKHCVLQYFVNILQQFLYALWRSLDRMYVMYVLMRIKKCVFCFVFLSSFFTLWHCEFVHRLLCCWIEHHVYEIYCRKGKGKLRIFLKSYFLPWICTPASGGGRCAKILYFWGFKFYVSTPTFKAAQLQTVYKIWIINKKKKGLSDQVKWTCSFAKIIVHKECFLLFGIIFRKKE